MTVQFQRSRPFGLGTALGAVLLLVGGLNLTDASPQFGPTWWAILLTVAVVAFFFVLALPAVTRARLTTQTIGRDYLVGQSGVAESDFSSGEGTAEVDGARWRATAHRESGLTSGDELVVVGVQGVFLSVEPKAKGAKRN